MHENITPGSYREIVFPIPFFIKKWLKQYAHASYNCPTNAMRFGDDRAELLTDGFKPYAKVKEATILDEDDFQAMIAKYPYVSKDRGKTYGNLYFAHAPDVIIEGGNRELLNPQSFADALRTRADGEGFGDEADQFDGVERLDHPFTGTTNRAKARAFFLVNRMVYGNQRDGMDMLEVIKNGGV